MNIPMRLSDWQKVKKTGRGYTRRELTVVSLLEKLAAEKPIKSFLNVGFHDYQDIRNRWWIDICRANDIDWHILEVYPPNVENFKNHAPSADRHRITLGNLRDIAALFTGRFDVFLHWHGPEHLEREEFLAVLPDILSRTARLTIFGCPDGREEQGLAYGNPFEEHLSFWTCADFQRLGFSTHTVTDKMPGHITAYRRLDLQEAL